MYKQWHERLQFYPDELANKVVQEQMRFFVEGCLLHQGVERQETLFYYDGVTLMLKKILAMIGGLNKVYFSVDEPRWIPFELTKMLIHPPNLWSRMQKILEDEKSQSLIQLYALIYETLELVETHMPQVDVNTTRQRMKALAVHGCDTKPILKSIGV